ncbi:MAG: hypothetical protein IKO84_06855 [Butyrivibrio sp.]|nr:hypothetical protein [Butyrivibrio sp.]
MKKLAIVLACVLTLSCFTGCGDKAASSEPQIEPATSGPAEEKTEEATDSKEAAEEVPEFDTEIEKTLYEASKMSDEELYAKAKEEKEKTVVYSTTSLAATAIETFLAKYPDLTIEMSDIGEADMFTKLSTEIGSAADGADMALLQNAYRVNNELISEDLLYNYFPESLKGVVDEKYQDPTAILFVSKLIFMNKSDASVEDLKNVWQLTEAAYKDKIFFKNPADEPVGMNFLIMLTSDEWNKKLSDAYKSYFGSEWNNTAEYKSCAYEFLDKFLANCNYTYTADGGICGGIAEGEPGSIGLFVFSKLRTNEVARANLQIAATGNDGAGIEGFAGFMYPTYAQVCADTDTPYTCALFINYLLSEEGGAAWNNADNMGTYLSNSSIALVPDSTGLDKEVDFWLDRCVIEDGEYLAANYADVYEYIASRIN